MCFQRSHQKVAVYKLTSERSTADCTHPFRPLRQRQRAPRRLDRPALDVEIMAPMITPPRRVASPATVQIPRSDARRTARRTWTPYASSSSSSSSAGICLGERAASWEPLATRGSAGGTGRSRVTASSHPRGFDTNRHRRAPSVCRLGFVGDGDDANVGHDNAAHEDDADRAGPPTMTTRSNYKETSGAVKGLVSGLTAVVNAFGGGGGGSAAAADDRATRRERREARALPSSPRDPTALRDDIAREFTAGTTCSQQLYVETATRSSFTRSFLFTCSA